jgi:hypothetical protein
MRGMGVCCLHCGAAAGLRRLPGGSERSTPCSFRIVQEDGGDVSIRCEHEHYEGGGFRTALDTMQFQLGGRSASIMDVVNYDDVIKTLRAKRGVAITAFLQTTAVSREDLEPLRQDVTRLCALLTLATGCKVACVAEEARNAAGQIVGGCRNSPPTRPFSTFVLIDTRNMTALARFIEQTFGSYKALETDYEMGRLIDARVDAITGGFLETRTLMAGVLAD